MARRRITLRHKRPHRLSNYLLSRRVLRDRVYAMTPLRFLQRLDLVESPELDGAEFLYPFDYPEESALLSMGNVTSVFLEPAAEGQPFPVTVLEQTNAAKMLPSPTPSSFRLPSASGNQLPRPSNLPIGVNRVASSSSGFGRRFRSSVDSRKSLGWRVGAPKRPDARLPRYSSQHVTPGPPLPESASVSEARSAAPQELNIVADAVKVPLNTDALDRNDQATQAPDRPIERQPETISLQETLESVEALSAGSPNVLLSEAAQISEQPPIREARSVSSADVTMVLHDPTSTLSPIDIPLEANREADNETLETFERLARVEYEEQATDPVVLSSLTETTDAAMVTPPRRKRIEEITLEKQSKALEEAGAETLRQPVVSRLPVRTEPAAEMSSDQLFARRDDVDLSPAAWAARLNAAFRPVPENKSVTAKPVAGPRTPERQSSVSGSKPAQSFQSPVTIPEAVRRFLKPRVGVDAASVPVHQGKSTDWITAANKAEAVTVDGEIALRSVDAVDTPHQMGLLAHELTHVVRQRHPRFIPPIARDNTDHPSTRPSPDHMDEEALARRVEARVAAAASGSVPTPAETLVGPGAIADESAVLSIAPVVSQSDDSWGGLPAPWEPLPDWVTALSSEPPVAESVEARETSHAAAPASLLAPAGSSSLKRADEGRVLDAQAPAPAVVPKLEDTKVVAPDLDALSKQVYAILKRRFEAERRRESL